MKKTLGKPLSKGEQMSNWEKRPLRPSQVTYAGEHCILCLFLIFSFCTFSNSSFAMFWTTIFTFLSFIRKLFPLPIYVCAPLSFHDYSSSPISPLLLFFLFCHIHLVSLAPVPRSSSLFFFIYVLSPLCGFSKLKK